MVRFCGETVLVAYGVPPNHVHLFSSVGRDLHTEWKFDAATFNGKTRQNFERLLRAALTAFLINEVSEITHADYRFVASPADLRKALHSHRYTHVVYYGHAVDDGGTLKPLHKVSVREMEHLLQNSGVEQVDILGCRSMTLRQGSPVLCRSWSSVTFAASGTTTSSSTCTPCS